MYKLFIADDEAIIREGLRCLLDWETLGFTIAGEAANGDAALQFLLSETPDLVLLDIRMPGMSGLDVVRIAREHGYDGKVVILSGYSDFNYARTAIRYGVLSYLTKPIDEDELLEIVTQIRNQLDSDASARDSSAHYRQKAYDSIIRDLLAVQWTDKIGRLFNIRQGVTRICRQLQITPLNEVGLLCDNQVIFQNDIQRVPILVFCSGDVNVIGAGDKVAFIDGFSVLLDGNLVVRYACRVP